MHLNKVVGVAILLGALSQATPLQQNSVIGIVLEYGSGRAISNAVIDLWADKESPKPLSHTVSDRDGAFAFVAVPEGAYSVVVAHPHLLDE